VTSNDLPRLAFAIAASVAFVQATITRARAAHARGSGWSAPAKAYLSVLAVSGTCWTAICLVAEASNALLWPGLVISSASGLTYLGFSIIPSWRATPGVETVAPNVTADMSDQVSERRLIMFVTAALGISGAVVGLRLGVWWLALPMITLLMCAWAILVVDEIRRGWNKE
jgi:hypothetical protein